MKTFKKDLLIVISLAVFLGPAGILLTPLPAGGQDRIFRVAYTEWFPYTYSEKGQAAGFEIDIFRAVAAEMGIQAEFRNLPWKRCLLSLQDGRSDMLISMLKTADREHYAIYPETHISISKTMLFVTQDNLIPFDGSVEALKGYSIGVIKGFSYGEAFDRAGYLNRDEAIDAEMLIRKLIGRRNDVAVENQAVIAAASRKMGVRGRIRFLYPPIHMNKLYVGFSKASGLTELSTAFSDTLKVFKTSDAYVKILEKYGITADQMDIRPAVR